jgi:hypothetical protein
MRENAGDRAKNHHIGLKSFVMRYEHGVMGGSDGWEWM